MEETDSVFDEKTSKTIIYYTALAVVGISLSGLAVKAVPAQLVGWSVVLYGALMAVAEERFFRKFLTNFFVSKLSPSIGLITSALIFTIFHFAIYGTQVTALVYVFFGGLILGWVAYRSQRLSPSQLGHIISNLVATMG